MVKKIMLLLLAHSCDKNDNTCCWQKRLIDIYPPKVAHGNGHKDDGTTKIVYADVFDRARTSELLGIELPKPGRPRRERVARPRLTRRLPSYIYLPNELRRMSPDQVIFPEDMDPNLKEMIVARMKPGRPVP